MRHMAKRTLSLFLALLLCLTLFPAAALAEEGTIRPVEDEENGGLSGTPAPTEEDEPGTAAGDGALNVPADDPAALPLEPATDEIQGIVASGSCGENLTWTLDDTGVLTISGEGEMTNWSSEPDVSWSSQRENIKEILIENGVTNIGKYAFRNCSNLTSVQIPESVTSLGSQAFYGCRSLTSVTIPVRVTSIGDDAFYDCSSLKSVTIPSSVTSIGVWAFANCGAIEKVCIDDLDWWLALTDPDGRYLPHGDLYLNGKPVTSVTISEGLLGLRRSMFRKMTSLESVIIPASVTSIGIQAFQGCSSLTTVTIPSSVTRIGASAFEGCSSLASVMIPESITDIGSSAFAFCDSLQEIRVAEGNKAYTSVDGVLYDASLRILLQCPGGKTGEVSIPEGVNGIEFSALQGCSCLKGVTIPASVTSIGKSAFASCSSLASMIIPAGVITIESGAFALCSSLRSVFFLGNAPTIRSGVFSNDRTTAVYPIDNPTWTADKLQDYGGTLTWVGYRDEARAYTIHFDPNGGSNAPEDQIKGHNVDITLTDAVPGRENASFLGWSTRRGATEPDYLPGDSFGLNADTTLYAVWKLEAPVLPTEAVLSLGSAKVCAGQEFTVELTMEKNPGLMYLSFRLYYDTASLEFLGAEDGVFTGWTVNREKSFLAWDADGDRTDNGVLLRLRFRVKEEARTGETSIALADLFATNYAEELLGIGSVPGTVTILPHTPGDVNGDGEVDGRDLVRLRKYLAGVPEIVIVEANANVNGDDVVDILDLIRLRKYLVQNDVILE